MRIILYTFLIIFTICGCAKNASLKTSLISNIASDSLNFDKEYILITKADFESYKNRSESNCVIDSSGVIQSVGLKITNDCNEICATYLTHIESKKRMQLFSNFDAGLIGAIVSPSCKTLTTYSSYDGDDYNTYYDYRSEINIYNRNFLKADSTSNYLNYYSVKWSIDSLYFLNENTLAVRIYEDNRNISSDESIFKYVKLKIRK